MAGEVSLSFIGSPPVVGVGAPKGRAAELPEVAACVFGGTLWGEPKRQGPRPRSGFASGRRP